MDDYILLERGDTCFPIPEYVWDEVFAPYGMWVKDYKDNEWMLWWDKKGDSTWAWGIYPEGEACCRLVTRVRVKYRWLSPAILFNLIIEFFDIWMMIKCMKGIKRRAEAWYGSSKTEA